MSSLLSSPLLPSPPTSPSPPPNPKPTTHSPKPPNPNSSAVPKTTLRLRARVTRLCRRGRLDHARHLFDSIPPPIPTLLWNALLIGYVCNSLPHHALLLFSLMVHRSRALPAGHSPDAYTVSSGLKACAMSGQLLLGRTIHCYLLRSRFDLTNNLVVSNSLLNMYASTSAIDARKNSARDTARKVFDEMPQRNVVSWNTIIAWYVKTRQPNEAFSMFKRLMESGIKPSPVSFVNVFPAGLSLEENYKRCSDALYGLLIKYGKEYTNDLFVVGSAISMFAGIGNLDFARLVFDRTKRRSIEVWNAMISGYEQNQLYIEAIDLFISLLSVHNINADKWTFLSTLVAISQLQDVKLGQQIHALLLKEKSPKLPVILYNALVVMYSRCGYVQTAFEVFTRMPERDLISWNTMITSMVQNNLNFEGLLLTFEMIKEGLFAADSVTLTALLSAASNLGSLKIGKEAHGYLIRHEIRWQGMGSYIIDMYAKSGCVETAKWYFDNCLPKERDRVTWNAMITAYTRNNLFDQAILVFHEMLKQGQPPNNVTLASILSVSDVDMGTQIHAFAVRSGLDKDLILGTSMIDMYAKCGDISDAEKVFEKLSNKSTATCNKMLSWYKQLGLPNKALELFRTMQIKSGTNPDSVTFLILLSVCGRSGLIDEGLHLYNSMDTFGVLPTPEHHFCAVDMLGKHGRVEEAYELVESLGKDGNYVGIWGSLLAACRVQGKLQIGKLVAEKILRIDRDCMVSNLYALSDVWDGLEMVRKEMKERRMNKDYGALSWVKEYQNYSEVVMR